MKLHSIPIKRVNIMVYQNHGLKMVIQWKRWMATEIHLDQVSWNYMFQVSTKKKDH